METKLPLSPWITLPNGDKNGSIAAKVYPARKRNIEVSFYNFRIDYNAYKSDLIKSEQYYVWFPRTVFFTYLNDEGFIYKRKPLLKVAAIQEEEITEDTSLYFLPVPNVYPKFQVCMGTVPKFDEFKDLIDHFWTSGFYMHVGGQYWPGENVLYTIGKPVERPWVHFQRWQDSSPEELKKVIFGPSRTTRILNQCTSEWS